MPNYRFKCKLGTFSSCSYTFNSFVEVGEHFKKYHPRISAENLADNFDVFQGEAKPRGRPRNPYKSYSSTGSKWYSSSESYSKYSSGFNSDEFWERVKREQNREQYRGYNNQTYESTPLRPEPKPEIKSDLVSLMKERGRGDGEIQAFFNIAGKFSGLTHEELKTLQLVKK
jgi:hypothetical protein